MKRVLNLIRSSVLLLTTTLVLTGAWGQSQLPECESTVPFRIVDLSNDPDGTHYTDSIERLGNCICNTQNNQNFVSFYLTLNPNVAMVEIGIVGGADPSGSGTYWVLEDLDGIFSTPGTCTQETPGGEFMCIEGAGPHKIVYKKPGSNLVQYYIHQIPKPMFPASGIARVGCAIPFPIYGLDNVVITPLSNTGGFSTMQCSNMVVYDATIGNYEFGAFPPVSPASYPYTVTYQICGDQQASETCGLYDECDTVTMTVYPPLSVSLPGSVTYCDGAPGVLITPTISGGFGPFNYNWTKDGAYFANTANITVSDTADYVLTVTDSITSFNASCVGIAEVQVLEGNDGYINAGVDQFVCESDPTVYLAGMVQYTTGAYWTTNGTGTFQDTTILFGGYQTDTVTTTATYTPSAYDMSTLDQVELVLHKYTPGCGATTDTLYVRFIEQVNTIPTAAPILCNGGTTTVNVTATGDPLSTFSYFWSVGSSGTSQVLPSGTYSVTAVDQYGCGDNTPITIANPTQITLTTSSTNTSTDIACDGNASVSISGGTAPYSVLWSTGETTLTTASNLCYGIYTVTVTDDNGCQAVISVVVNKPSCSSFNVTATSTNVSCYTGADGTAAANATGGTPGYTYLWSPSGGTNANASGLTSGTYTVTVTDGGGCVDVASVTILQPAAITNTMTHTDVTSIGGTNGTATANPLGGTPFTPSTYTYSWSTTPVQTTQTATALSSDTNGVMYYVTIQDSLLCSKVDSVLINQPPCNNFTLAVNTTNVACYGNTTGKAKLLIAHGTAPFVITWSGGTVSGDQMSVSNLAAGTYTVTVTDASGCTTFSSFTITQPNQLSVSLVPTNVTCSGLAVPNGTIDATVYGGTQPYQYSWTLGTSASTQDLYFLGTGFYLLQVTDANKCTTSGGASISTPSPLGVTVVSSVDVTCYEANNGSINITPTGGISPYTYSWTSTDGFSATTQDISGLASSDYTLTLTDANGCTYSGYQDYINQPDSMNAIALVIDSVSCLGSNDGSIDLTILGGNPNATAPFFTYAWTGPSGYLASTEDISGLIAGTYNVSVTDFKGCTASTSIVMPTIADTTNPMITCPGNQTANTSSTTCTYTHSGTAWNATATDNCVTPTLTWVLTGATTGSGSTTLNGVIFNKGVTTVEWFATDGLGNQDSCEYTVTITDVTNPSILTCATSQSVNVDAGQCNYTQTGTAWDATASDNCSGVTLTATLAGATTASGLTTLAGVDFNKGITIVTWTAVDAVGLTATCTFNITVIDNQAPSFVSCGTGSPYVVSADAGQCTYTHSGTAWNATATDICVGPVALAYVLTGATTGVGTSLNGQVFNKGITLVTWTATDGSNNSATCSYTVTVNDTEDPLISCVANQTIPTATLTCTYTVPGTAWNATATDNCSGTITYAYTLSGATTGSGTSLSGVVFNLGATLVTWTATDASLNTSTCSFTVTVEDETAPIITSCGVLGAVTVNTNVGTCTYTQNTNAWNPTATDNCSGVFSYAYTLTGVTTGTGSTLNGVTFNKGLTTVNWVVTDANGNSSSCSFTVTVVDNQAPAITCPATAPFSVTTDAGDCTYETIGTAWNATATDNCGVTSLTYVLTGATTGTGTSLNGVLFNKGLTTVTWTALDAANNPSTCIYTVTVTDDEDPSILSCGVTTSVTVNANTGICTYTHQGNTWNASGSDNCSTVTMSYVLSGVTSGSGTSLAGQTFNLGTTTVTWTATDGSSNTQTCSFTVTVVDNQLPVLTSCGAVGNQTVFADASQCNYTQTGLGWDATATDNCSIASLTYTLTGATTGTGTSLENVDFGLGTTTVTWTVVDGSNNSTSCSFTVLVRDNQFPAITTCGAGNQTVNANNGVCTFTQATNAWNAIATDNCTVSTLTYSLSGATTGTGTTLNGVTFNLGATTVLWTATDNSGNVTTCSYIITVLDNQNPGIANCPLDITTGVDAGDCGAIVSWTIPTFSDNCGYTFTASHTPGAFFSVGTTTVTYTVTDGSGNVSICEFDVTVNDDEDPTITCSANIASCNPMVTYAAPVVGDNCGVSGVIQTAGLPSGVNYPVGTTTNVYQVTDIHGNTSTCSFTVTIHPLPVAATTDVDVSCNGNDNGSIDLTVTSGTAPFTYDWDNGATSQDLTNLAPGTYVVDVYDAFGCTTSASATITEPAVLTLTAEDDHVNCYNGTDGAIDITIAGGTTPYSYDWNTGATSQDLNVLIAGNYDVTVTDALGCVVTYATTLTQPDTLTIQAVVYNATCTAANGSIQVLVNGGTTPYAYDWSNGTSSQNLNNVTAGIYTLDVTDAQGCTVAFTGTIDAPSNLAATTLSKDVSCYGGANGEIQVIMQNGNAPFTYEWSNGGSTSIVEDLVIGEYEVLITDAFGCQVTLYDTIIQPDSLYVVLTASIYAGGNNISTYGGNDGYITSEVFGGTSPYSYIWSNGETTENVYNLDANGFTLLVTDENGCVASATSRLTQPGMLEMPQGYSPNGDGNNDYFVVHGIEAYPENKITIYNRWGNIVYEYENYQNEWNGENTSGEPLPDGTYFVVLTVFTAEEDVTLTGYVDLRR